MLSPLNYLLSQSSVSVSIVFFFLRGTPSSFLIICEELNDIIYITTFYLFSFQYILIFPSLTKKSFHLIQQKLRHALKMREWPFSFRKLNYWREQAEFGILKTEETSVTRILGYKYEKACEETKSGNNPTWHGLLRIFPQDIYNLICLRTVFYILPH